MAAPGTPNAFVTPSLSITKTAAATAVIRAMNPSRMLRRGVSPAATPPEPKTPQ